MFDANVALPPVLEGVTLNGQMNVEDAAVLGNLASAVRRGWPQVWEQERKSDQVCLVGGGPSLTDTEDELRDLVWSGAKLVTMNGSYQWCIDHNLKPDAQIVLDARQGNARFVSPAVTGCRYWIASQCHPDVFDACEGREYKAIWHSVNWDGPAKDLLDAYYLKQWKPIVGGTTVGLRSLSLLHMLGYVRFHLFGLDSCYLAGHGHAFVQAENDGDKRAMATVSPSNRPDLSRDFLVAGWHLKQLEDWLQFIRINGHLFLLNVHGDGLLAWALQAAGDVTLTLDDAPNTLRTPLGGGSEGE